MRIVVAVFEAKFPRKAGIGTAAGDVDALRGIELMTVDQQHAKSGQRLAAPATRRPSRVPAIFDVDRKPDKRIHVRKDCGNIGVRACGICNLGLP